MMKVPSIILFKNVSRLWSSHAGYTKTNQWHGLWSICLPGNIKYMLPAHIHHNHAYTQFALYRTRGEIMNFTQVYTKKIAHVTLLSLYPQV